MNIFKELNIKANKEFYEVFESIRESCGEIQMSSKHIAILLISVDIRC